MKQNMGTLDRIIRVMIAIVIAALYLTSQIEGTLAIVLLVIAGIFILTSFMSFCPLYTIMGLSSKKKQA